MMRVLIPYGTSEGQTARIAEYLADVLRDQGHEAFPVDIKRSGTPDPAGYDAVIVGASVRMGKHQSCVRDFVRKHCAALERLPSAFFSVSLAAHDDTEKARDEAEGCIEKFVQQTGWRPGKVGLASGKGSPDTDTSRDYVYTDWESVKRFGEEFLETSFPKAWVATAG
jgi:menaquinone-dependent protoporphyrinogen oxidase